MNVQEMVIQIIDGFYNNNQLPSIGLDTTTTQLGMDDLDVIELGMVLEETFFIQIGDELIEDFMDASIRIMVSCLENLIGTSAKVQWQKVGF